MSELESRWRDLGEFIREQRHLGQLSLRKLSEMAGISNPYLSQIERGLRKPSAEILQQIAKALHISAETLYVRAGILDEPLDSPDLVDLVRRDPWLTEEQKKTLVTVYDSFRATNAAAAALAEAVLAEEERAGEGGAQADQGVGPADPTDPAEDAVPDADRLAEHPLDDPHTADA
jgi:transcriptional regulator with XRE-family HTH domain